MNEIKLFKMNDCDWVAASTLDEAKKCLAEMVSDGVVNEEFEDEFIDMPFALSDEQMDTFKLTDEDDMAKAMGKCSYSSPEGKKRYEKYASEAPTFRQALQKMIDDGATFPCFFASTEF